MPEQRHNDGRGTGIVPSQIECFPEVTPPVRELSRRTLVFLFPKYPLNLRESIPFLTSDSVWR